MLGRKLELEINPAYEATINKEPVYEQIHGNATKEQAIIN